MVAMENNKGYIFLVCVFSFSYPVCQARVLYYVVLCGLSVCVTSLNVIPNTARIWWGLEVGGM